MTTNHPFALSEVEGSKGRTRGPEKGLTLIELMIGIALMLVLTGQVVFIFNQARTLYLRTDAMVQVYQNARVALDSIERDITNAVKSSQMEFFNDTPGSTGFGAGFYDEGEECPELKDSGSRFLPTRDYVFGLAVKQPKEYKPKDGPEDVEYRHDGLYLRTITPVRGEMKEALVEYRLNIGAVSDPKPRPVLQRIVKESSGVDPATKRHQIRIHPPDDVCYYVSELTVELYLRDKGEPGIGHFYSVKEALSPTAGGKPPLGDPNPPRLANVGAGDTPALTCSVTGGFSKDPAGSSGQLHKEGHLTVVGRLPVVGPGDRFYISPTDSQVRTKFRSTEVTVRRIVEDGTRMRVEFEEQDEIAAKFTTGPSGANLPDPLEVSYRVGWLPAAIRVTMKVKDGKSQELRTVSRVFKILRS